jgi:hypothetical protein
MRLATLPAALLIAGHLAACQHQPTISYPKLPAAGQVEAGFDCARLDDAILKTEAVRWVMREDGARLLSPGERFARTTADVATSVAASVACLFCFSPVWLGEEGHAALDGADRRLLSLLKLKQDKQCAERPTALAGVSDLQMHDAVALLLVQESQNQPRPDVGALRAERMRLLDKLRP